MIKKISSFPRFLHHVLEYYASPDARARALTYTVWQSYVWARTRWLGFKVFQFPTDLFAIQELLFATKPDFVVETGTYEGGSAVFYASMFALLQHGIVISIDIDISKAKQNLRKHFLKHRIRLLEGDSRSPMVFERVKEIIGTGKHVHVFLDSDHHTQHVKAELDNLSKIVNVGDYIVVFDTNLQEVGGWKKNNPMIAVRQFLEENENFVVDKRWEKYMITFCRNGFLKRVK